MTGRNRFVMSVIVFGAASPFLLGTACPPAGGGGTTTGSCCAADGTCTVTAQADCSAGTWTSGGVCSPNPCTQPVTPQLFIANFTAGGVISYKNPSTVNGNVAPDTNITGPQTNLMSPAAISIAKSDVMLVANFIANGSVLSYTSASTANGNVVPVRNVQGAATGLAFPVAMVVDKANDLLYVTSNIAPFKINVYSGASTGGFNGNLPPARTITSAALNAPIGMNFGANDDLYVANAGDNKILVFAGASGKNGSVAPDRTLTNALFSGIFDCFVDSGDRLYVVNGSGGGANKNKVYVVNGASTKNGAVTVDSTLAVTGAVTLGAMTVDKNQTAYIVDGSAGSGAIYQYDNIQTRNGAFAPDRSIAGANTQLSGPLRVFLVE